MANQIFRTQLFELLTKWRGHLLVLGFSSGLCTISGPCSLTAMSFTQLQFSFHDAKGLVSDITISLREITDFNIASYEQIAGKILQTMPWERTEEQLGMFSNNSVREIADIHFAQDGRLLLGVLHESADCVTATRPWREDSHSRTVV